MFTKTKSLAVAFAVVSLLGASSVWADSTWNYAGFTEGGTNAGGFGNSFSQTDPSVGATASSTKLTVTAFSTTGTGGAFATAAIGNYGAGSGFGVKSQTEGLAVSTPNHSMDNFASTDMLALHFTDNAALPANAKEVNVILTSLSTGWHNTNATLTGCGTPCGTDSDISLLRWTKSVAPTISGNKISDLLTAGWVLVNNYADMVDDTAKATGLTGSSTSSASSWWLISAYNSSWGSTGANAALSDGNDFVKVLASVSAVPVVRDSVPEPGSLALVAAALIGITSTRRRWMKQR